MKKVILFALVLIGCSKAPMSSVPSTNGTFSIDNTSYTVQNTLINNSSGYTTIMATGGTSSSPTQMQLLFKNIDTIAYTVILINSGVSNVYSAGYYRKSNIIFSSTSAIKTTKNANNTYTVAGNIFLYENYDSTKRVTISANFTTL